MTVKDWFTGRRYRHYKGSEYVGLCLAKEESTQANLCVYQSVENGQVWVRPHEEFFGLATLKETGERVPRFART